MMAKAMFEQRITSMKAIVLDRTSEMARCHLNAINMALETLDFFLDRIDEQPTLAMNRMQEECHLIDTIIRRHA